MRALVVEDQMQMRAIVRKMLQQMKHFQTVDESENGDKGWERIAKSNNQEKYGLVVSDVNMPVLDGIGLLKRCREHPEYRYIPFIMISASSQGPIVVSSLGEWGAQDFIVKPFSFDLLQQRVGALIKRMESPEESLYRQAEQLLAEGEIDNALKLINHWERESRLARARWFNLKGECFVKTGEPEKAVAQFENAMTSSNIFLTAHKNYAHVNQKLGNLDKAIKALKYAEELSPTDSHRSLNLGRLLLQTGQEEEGKKCFNALIKRTQASEKEVVLKIVAATYLEGGLYKEAENMYVITLNLNPRDVEASNRLGIALRQQGKFEEAERVYLSAIRSNPKHPGLYHNLGVLYVAMRAYDKAERLLRKALDIDPEFEASRTMLENILRKAKASSAAAGS